MPTVRGGRSELPMRPMFRATVLAALLALGAGGYWYFVQENGSVGELADRARTLMAAWTGGGAKPAAPAAAPAQGGNSPVPIEAATVRVGSIARTVTAVGSTVSNESVVIRPEVAGRITEIAFIEGQAVTRGTVLFRMDDSVARATLAQAQASLAFSRSDLQRAEELFRQGSGAGRAREQAQAKLLADDAATQLAKAQLDKLTLIAPFDGVVGLRKVSVGDVVQPGKDFVNLEQIDTLKLDFRVPELYLPAVRIGQSLSVAVDAFPGRRFQGEVYAIDPLIDVNGRAVVIRARVPNTDRTLRPGLFARVELTLTVTPNAILVPEQAITSVGQDLFVFKVVDGRAKQTKVRIGNRRNAEVEVAEGLQPDDVIVVSGQIRVRDGVPVRVTNAKPAGT
ncbi:efflux RND transporter periplasmic adaptor subunit [Azospirillum oleiclasticum]